MGSKSRRPGATRRWKPTVNTFEVAASRAAKLSQATVDGLAASLNRASQGLEQPQESAAAWNDLRTALAVSARIERLGVVKGLEIAIEAATLALLSIRARSMESGSWVHAVLTQDERDVIDNLIRDHVFQVGQLSAGEFERVYLQVRQEFFSNRSILVPVKPRAAQAAES